ncbi:MAG: nucleotidyltransferase domain-containing protein [Candidatus Woesearchaeota archaeon]
MVSINKSNKENTSNKEYTSHKKNNSKSTKIIKILDEVKKEIKPNLAIVDKVILFLSNLNENLKKEKINASCIPGGSIAKNTFLKDDFDIDVFVKFNFSYKNNEISKIFENFLIKNNINYKKIHGSRDYFHVLKDDYLYEFVPILEFKNPNEILNITDMSYLHVSWVKKNLKKNQENEIRLTKKFMKAINVYGAESFIRGFSGHIVDILIIKYGSFLNLLIQAKKWKNQEKPIIIDIEKYYKNKKEVIFNLNKSKLQSPLIIIDPILKTRNASAGLSYEKFNLFIEKSIDFLKNPEKKFFETKTPEKILKKNKNSIILQFNVKKFDNIKNNTPFNKKIQINKKNNNLLEKNLLEKNIQTTENKDILGCKIKKIINLIKNDLLKYKINILEENIFFNYFLEENIFKKKESNNEIDFILVILSVNKLNLPKEIELTGPSIEFKFDCENFKKKHKKVYIKNKRLFAKIEIKKTLYDLIKETFNKSYFTKYFDLIKII